MAELLKLGLPTPATVGPEGGERLGTFRADVDIVAGDACRLTATGCALSSGAAQNANAQIHGWAGHSAKAGEVVTLWNNINFGYGAAADIAPAASFYLSATVPGGVSTTATTGGVNPAALGLPGGRLHVKQVLKTS